MQLHLCLHPHLAINGATEKVLVIIGVEVKGSHKISVPAAASTCDACQFGKRQACIYTAQYVRPNSTVVTQRLSEVHSLG